MSRGKKIIKGSMLNVVQLVLQIGISFFMMPFLVHSLGDKNYGLWSLVATFIGYYGLFDLGISAAVARFVSRTVGNQDENERRIITSTSFYIFSVLGGCALLGTFLFVFLAKYFVNTPDDLSVFRIILFITGFTLSISFPMRVFGGTLVANLRYDINSWIHIGFAIARTVMIVYVVQSGYGIIGMSLVVSSSTILSSLLIIHFAYKIDKGLSIALSFFRMNCVKELFGYSIFAFLGRIGDLLKYSVDTYVIAKFINLVAVTHYSVAMNLTQYFIQFVNAFGGRVLSPVFSQEEGKGDFDSLRKKFMFTTKICSFVAFFLGIMIMLYGRPFIQRWMGNEYLDAYPVLFLLTIPTMLGLSQTPLFGALYGVSKHYIITYVNIAEGLSNLVLSIILVKDYGIIGVAIGTAIPMTITTMFIYPYYICKVLTLSLMEYYGALLKSLIIAIISLLLIWLLLKHKITPSYPNIVFFSAIQCIIYWAAVIIFGFSNDERKYLYGHFRA